MSGLDIDDVNFNSIKVRLRPVGCEIVGRLAEFQFHKGSIKTSARKAMEAVMLISIP